MPAVFNPPKSPLSTREAFGKKCTNMTLVFFMMDPIELVFVYSIQNMISFCFRLNKEYESEAVDDWSGIFWPGRSNSIPVDSPECGWQGELCTESRTSYLLLQGLPALLAILLVITVITVVIWKIR